MRKHSLNKRDISHLRETLYLLKYSKNFYLVRGYLKTNCNRAKNIDLIN